MENEFKKYLELIFIKKCKNKKNSSSKECLNIFFLKKPSKCNKTKQKSAFYKIGCTEAFITIKKASLALLY